MVYSAEPTIVYQFLSKLLHANRSLSHANRVSDHGSLARRETVFGGQRQQAPNRLQAVFVPYRDRERANAPAQNRGYSAKDRKSQVAQDCVVLDAVRCEPVSNPNSLITGKITGNFA